MTKIEGLKSRLKSALNRANTKYSSYAKKYSNYAIEADLAKSTAAKLVRD